MFEFLKELSTYRNYFALYERAESCEKVLGDYNDILIFRVFCEAAIKSIYAEEFRTTESVEKINFGVLLNNVKLQNILISKYKFNDIITLNSVLRLSGNSRAHAEKPDYINENQRLHIFQCMYRLASQIYLERTHKIVPKFSVDEYNRLLNQKKNPDELKVILEDYEKNLVQKDETIAEYNEELELAKQKLELLRADLLKEQELSKTLSIQLENERTKNIDSDELKKKQALIENQEAIISRLQSDLNITSERLRNAEASNNEDKIERYSLRNKELENKLELAISEQKKYKKQIDELAENTCDKSIVTGLLDQIDTLQKEIEKKEDKYEELKNEYEISKGRINELESPIKSLENLGKKLDEQYEPLLNIEEEKQKIQNEFKKNTPICRNCGNKLVLTRNRDAWRCENWQNGDCRNAYTRLEGKEAVLGEKLRLLEQESNVLNEKIIEWISNNCPNNNIENNNGNQRIIGIKAEKNLIKQYESRNVDFKKYPLSIINSEPKSAIFQSIAVPAKLFSQRDDYDIGKHSKFRVWFDKILTDNKRTLTAKEQTIYSLVLRLLNRGIILETNDNIEKLLKNKFSGDGFGKVSNLTNYIEYKNPVLVCDSKREAEFANFYFPKVLGKSWASYVTPQVSFDELLPDTQNNYSGCRADFLVAGVNKAIKPLIIEIDGHEHEQSAAYDYNRRFELLENGYIVASYMNEQVVSRDERITTELQTYFNNCQIDDTVNLSDKLMIACKLQHQFAIAIVKALEEGYVSSKTSFTANVSTSLLSESEINYILGIAICEVEELISHFSKLYGYDIDIDLCVENAKPIVISVGDGEPGVNGILIRDNYFNYDYLCEIHPFTRENIIPENINEKNITYFLNYIFKYDSFREGQYEAIKRVLQKKDSIALLPTGSGKSIIYQLSSFLVPGMIIVISPLKSLIIDQISNLNNRNGIDNAIGIYSKSSDNSRELYDRDFRHMKCNATSLLYISPERMQMPNFRDAVQDMLINNNVFGVAIDEAHCVSEWGHDFRPAYLVIGKNGRKLFSINNLVPVMFGLTGTASTKVREDMQRVLGIKDNNAIIYPETFERNELVFSVEECTSSSKAQQISYTIRQDMPDLFGIGEEEFFLRKGNETYSGIIFTPYTDGRSIQYSAKGLERQLSSDFANARIATYFSKVPRGWDRATWETSISENAKLFRENEINLLIATKAFGMGIDKGNIRYTIHDGMPQSIESFYQEAGRAGRDGNTSHCIVLFSNDNKKENEELLNPGLKLEELRNQYSDSEGNDDVHVQLYFHTQGFKGIEAECATLDKIIDNIIPLEFAPGSKQNLFIDTPLFNQNERYDNGKTIAQAIVRLINLGIIEDYVYDYVGRYFTITLGSISKEAIENCLLEYVKSFNKADTTLEQIKFLSIKEDGKSFLKKVSHQMVNYTYSQIEQGRRRQLINVYQLLQKVSNFDKIDQDRIIKDEVNNYFDLPKLERRNPIDIILNSEEILMDVALEIFDISKGKVVFDRQEKEKAKKYVGRAMRELESAATRADLILVKVLSQIVADSYEPINIANDLYAIDNFLKNNYKKSKEDIDDLLGKVFNFFITIDTNLFDSAIDVLAKNNNISTLSLLSTYLQHESITDTNRDYIAMHYYTESIKHII